ALAHDCAAAAQGLDRAQGRRRGAHRRDVPRPPGPSRGSALQSRAPQDPRRVDEELPARGTVRPQRELLPELAELAPKGERRMGANPHANGGILLRDLRMPDFQDYAVDVPDPGAVEAEDTRVLGRFLRDVIQRNRDPRTFRLFGPDE